MQLAGYRGGHAAGASPGPLLVPGAGETPERHELAACSAVGPVSCRAHLSSIRPPAPASAAIRRADRVARGELARVRGVASTAALWLPRYDTRSVPCR